MQSILAMTLNKKDFNNILSLVENADYIPQKDYNHTILLYRTSLLEMIDSYEEDGEDSKYDKDDINLLKNTINKTSHSKYPTLYILN